MNGPMIHNKQGLTIPGRRLAIINASIDIDKSMNDQMFEVMPNFLLTNEYPNLVMIPMLHRIEGVKQKCISLALLNLAEDESIFLKRGEILGSLEASSIEIAEIIKEDWSGPVESNEKENTEIPLEKKFITSPAEVNTQRKVKLQDAEVRAKYRKQFKLLCKKFEDIFQRTPLILIKHH